MTLARHLARPSEKVMRRSPFFPLSCSQAEASIDKNEISIVYPGIIDPANGQHVIFSDTSKMHRNIDCIPKPDIHLDNKLFTTKFVLLTLFPRLPF